MSSIIQGYAYDIFTSYRQKDNKYDGWVTEFVENLRRELDATFKEETSVYFDINPHDGLLETHDVADSLREKLKCLIFIPVLSRTYCDPKSFAWENEFKAFVDSASGDRFGLKVRLPNGNVASRVLPVRIYDLNEADIKLCESVLRGVVRGMDFIYSEPGVNRPLKPDDDEKANLNRTKYRNQINKVGNAIFEIISGLQEIHNEQDSGSGQGKEDTLRQETKVKRKGSYNRSKLKYLAYLAVTTILVIAGIVLLPKAGRGSAGKAAEVSVALMPFQNLTGDSSRGYVAEMHHLASEQELGKICQIKPLRIVGPRTTAAIAKDRMSLTAIATEAGLDYIIEGSITGTAGMDEIMLRIIRIFPQEELVFADNYSIDRKNIYIVYKTIAEKLVRNLGIDLQPSDILKLAQPHEIIPQSLEAYARGMQEIEKGTVEGNKKGLAYLHEAVRIEPDDAFSNAGLALGYLTIAHSPLDPGDALVNGEKWAFRAFMIDSTIAEVHAALAISYLYKSWRFRDAEKHFKIALELDPTLDMAHYHYAWALHLWGRTEEAIAEHKLAQKYDPFNPLHTAWLGELYLSSGRYEEALQAALKSLEIQPDYMIGYIILGRTYAALGRFDDAIRTHQKLTDLYPGQMNELCLTYIAAGRIDEAESVLEEIEKRDPAPRGMGAYNRAKIYGALHRADEAFRWLNYEPHHGFLAWASVNKNLVWLHDDPRWAEFLKKVNLPYK
ncbi:MAG: tetratricopeptide repeat protein [Bacteroidales bacterium]|nr:tetratricopeptide repeat protein [Bacteroidales bacterium]